MAGSHTGWSVASEFQVLDLVLRDSLAATPGAAIPFASFLQFVSREQNPPQYPRKRRPRGR